MINMYNDNGRRPIILSSRNKRSFPINDFATVLVAGVWFQQLLIGTFSYATLGVTGLAALICKFNLNAVSRQFICRTLKKNSPEIT